MNKFAIGSHIIGGGRCFVVGEVAQAHDGSLGMAHAFIDAIAAAGADAVKFQTHIADAESSAAEPWRVRFSTQDPSRFDYWKRMEFTEVQWAELRTHAGDRGLAFLSSPFSNEAVDLLERIGMPAWKIASGELTNPLLLERVCRTGRPVLLSSGMSTLTDVDAAAACVRAASCPLAVLQCSSTYPTPPEQVGLNMLREFRARYDCPVGLSDHSGTIYAGLGAAALGADLLEVHVTLSRDMFGPDVVASITHAELARLVEGVRFVERALASPADKEAPAVELQGMQRVFTKSLFAAEDLRAGARIERSHVTAKKPGTGIPVAEIDRIVGRRLAADVPRGTMILLDHLTPADVDDPD